MKNKFDITIKHRYNESSNQRNINKREYIMNKLQLNDIVIMKFDKNERACLGFVDSIINDEIVSISNFTTNEQIDEFYHDGTFAHSNDMLIRVKKINDEQLLRLIDFHYND